MLLSWSSYSADGNFVKVAHDSHLAKSASYFLALSLWFDKKLQQ